jgi:acetoin utilization deacetylase AcuC-like enzyme
MIIITDPRCTEYSSHGHPERPQRISNTVALLRSQTDLAVTWEKPLAVEDPSLLRAHSAELVKSLDHPEDFDADTPAHPGIADHARRSVGSALHALELAGKGKTAFSLMRPPGHHATPNHPMGFCYLNSIAIAVLEARAKGFERVAVFDFDVHHGNGTEDILVDKPGCAFISIHQHPCYPGTGTASRGSNCFNFPVRPEIPRQEYRAALSAAFGALKKFGPDLVAVSAGFDAYSGDPLANGTLEAEDFHWLGQTIRQLEVPAFSVLEGGYSNDLPKLILAYLNGLDGR